MDSLKRTAPAFALVAMLALALVVPVARSYELQGQAWPTRAVTYFNGAPGWSDEVHEAVRTWNSAGAPVRFERTSRSRAQVIIRLAPRSVLEGCSGSSQVGYSSLIRQAPVWLSRGCDHRGAVMVATHELGHILGLGHDDDRCAVMNTYGVDGVPYRCIHSSGAEAGDTLHPDDIAGLKRLYPEIHLP
jgi:predicted Zn-dependent protease